MKSSEPSLRICMASDSYWPRVNGATVSIEIFRRELQSRGHRISLLVPDYPDGTGVGSPDDEGVVRLPSYAVPVSKEDRLITWIRGFRQGETYMEDWKPQILHAQTEFSTLDLLKKFRKKSGIPMVMTCHTYWEQYLNRYIPLVPKFLTRTIVRAMTRGFVKGVDLVITPSQHMRRVLESYGIDKPMAVIPTGIDPALFLGADRNRGTNPVAVKNPQWSQGPLLLFVGRISQEKNLDFLIPVLQDLLPRHPGLKLLLVGDGPYHQGFLNQLRHHRLEDHVHFAGYVSRQDLKHWYALADVFVFPSKTETQGLVTIESMMCGTPVVALGEMGTLEVMNGDNGGFMVKDDPREFSSRVHQLLSDRHLWVEKSSEALAYSGRWTIGAQADRLEEVYRSLLK